MAKRVMWFEIVNNRGQENEESSGYIVYVNPRTLHGAYTINLETGELGDAIDVFEGFIGKGDEVKNSPVPQHYLDKFGKLIDQDRARELAPTLVAKFDSLTPSKFPME